MDISKEKVDCQMAFGLAVVREWHPRGCGFKHQLKHLRGIRCMSNMKVFAARSTFHREDVYANVVIDVLETKDTSILYERCYLCYNDPR